MGNRHGVFIGKTVFFFFPIAVAKWLFNPLPSFSCFKLQKCILLSGEMVQWKKHLPSKPEDQSLDLQDPQQTGQAWWPSCNPTTLEAKTSDPQGRLVAILTNQWDLGWDRNSVSVNKVENYQRRQPASTLDLYTAAQAHVYPAINKHAYMCIPYHTQTRGGQIIAPLISSTFFQRRKREKFKDRRVK